MKRLLLAIFVTLSSTILMASEKSKHTDPHLEIYGGYVMETSKTSHSKEDAEGYEIGIGVSKGAESFEHLYWTAEVDYESLESGDIKSYTFAVVPKYAITEHLWLGAGINYIISDHDGHDLDGFGYQFHVDFHITEHAGAYLKYKIAELEDDHHHETDTSAFSFGLAYIF
ncbi:MAG: outer membrane beta-barrel protein [Sulfurimonadaceae bacterium]|nr:outer membrane beta-barrel protein [Sulfurimonadaceae bacterium]